MRAWWAIPVLAAVTACGQHRMDPDLQAYAEEFEQHAAQYGVRVEAVPMEFVDDMEPGYNAKCYPIPFNAVIKVSRQRWANMKYIREKVVAHEQGHCVFGMFHTTGGIMDPTVDRVDETDYGNFFHGAPDQKPTGRDDRDPEVIR